MTTLKVRTAIALRVVARTSMLLAALVLMTASVRADDIVTHWNKVMLRTVAAGGTNPWCQLASWLLSRHLFSTL
jgi:hypothetical protein